MRIYCMRFYSLVPYRHFILSCFANPCQDESQFFQVNNDTRNLFSSRVFGRLSDTAREIVTPLMKSNFEHKPKPQASISVPVYGTDCGRSYKDWLVNFSQCLVQQIYEPKIKVRDFRSVIYRFVLPLVSQCHGISQLKPQVSITILVIVSLLEVNHDTKIFFLKRFPLNRTSSLPACQFSRRTCGPPSSYYPTSWCRCCVGRVRRAPTPSSPRS